jgi:hypothetical protein
MTANSTLERPAPVVEDPAAQRPSDRAQHTAALGWVFTAFFGVFGWATGLSKLADNSFFWHLRTGEYILDHGIPHHDVFSYTAPGAKWVAQSWLAEVTYAALYRSLGGVGIRLFVGAVGAGIGVLAYRLALRLVRDRLVACGITAGALAGIYMVWSERPLLVGVLFLLVLLWVVEVPDSIVGRHPIVVVPMLMWLWANTHGTFELGFAYLGLHLLGRWVDGARPWQGRERRLLLATGISGAVVFANPYGTGLVLFPIRLLSRGDILAHVVEWQSPDFRQTWGIALALWLVVFMFAIARGRHRVTRRDLIVTVPMLLIALWAVRNVALAPLVCLPVVARAFARDHEQPAGVSRRIVVAGVATLLLVGVVIGAQASTEKTFDFANYPVKALSYVETRPALRASRLLTTDVAAGYVILRYWPDQQVFIDDRYDMYPTRVIYDYFTLLQGRPGWARVLDHYGVQTIVWKRATPLGALLDESSAWTRIHRDATDAVWVRRVSESR